MTSASGTLHHTTPHHVTLLGCIALAVCTVLLAACGGGGNSAAPPQIISDPGPPVNGPAWWGFARDAQHSATGAIATRTLSRILWQTPVDLAPRFSGGDLLAHYGSPIVTSKNTVVMPIKTSATGAFRLDARLGSNGALLWTAASDYVLPAHDWLPSYNLVLTQSNRLYAPGAGGKLYFRDDADATTGTMQTVVFYGSTAYAAAPSTFDASVIINTPLTADAQGNVFFGFLVAGANPAGLVSGIARVTSTGVGSWVSASVAANDLAISQVAMNSAPALSSDGSIVYVAVNSGPSTAAIQSGYLLALNSATLATQARTRLIDPNTGTPADINDNATSSPTVGPDGDIYFGVLEANFPAHNARGWLLHFNAALDQTKTPGSFGWDDTASIIPASAVPAYSGTSAYLLVTKYNDYAGAGTGAGRNRLAVLDPSRTQVDAISGFPVMAEVLTILAPTPDPGTVNGVREWCINTAAVDPLTHSALVNNEDGVLYRWDFASNTLSERITLTSGIGEAYTPTVIGPDGSVFAMNNGVLFAIGQ